MKALDDDKDMHLPDRNSRLTSSTMTPAGKKDSMMYDYSITKRNIDLE